LQGHGGSARKQEREIEANFLGKGKQEQIEDKLSHADKDVLRWMDPFAGRRFEHKVGKKRQSQKQKHIFQRSGDRSI